MKPSTLLCHDDELYFEQQGAIVPPIFQNSLFAFKDWDAIDKAFDQPEEASIYTRGTNPTVKVVEEKLARLAGGEKARLFASGMGAIAAGILSCVEQGAHIITGQQIYGPANNFMNTYLKDKAGVSITYVENKVAAFEQAIRPETSLIYLESPGSLKFPIQDLKALTSLAQKNGIKTMIDNTWATPIFQKPLEFGIDLEAHSCSKYLGGHSDIVSGVLIGKKALMDQIQLQEQAWLGAKMAPFEAWLLLRSLRTLSIRMKQHMESAVAVASFLEKHPAVQKVYFPGLPSHPGHQLAKQQMHGYSALMSFELKTKSIPAIKAFVNGLQLFKLGVSWGGHDSLVYPPVISYLKEQTPAQFEAMGIAAGLVRISIGLEDVSDLIADLKLNLHALID